MSGPLAKYKLSKQEQQVLLLSMAGHADKFVAERLGIQLDTVRVYWKRIRVKTNRATRAEVIALMASEATLGELEAAHKENEQLLGEIVRRRGVEEELAFYREVFACSCVGLAVDGGDGVAILRLNKAFADLHGYAHEELIGRPIDNLMAPHERASAPQVTERLNEVGEVLLSAEHVRKDGTVFPVLKHVTRISSGGSRVNFRIYTIIALEQVQTWEKFVREP